MYIPKKYLTETVLFYDKTTPTETVLLTEALSDEIKQALNNLKPSFKGLLTELNNSKTQNIPEDIICSTPASSFPNTCNIIILLGKSDLHKAFIRERCCEGLGNIPCLAATSLTCS